MNYDYGSVLRETRKRADLTQDEIAPLIQTSRPTVSKLENGDRALKLDDFIQWMQVVSSRLQVQNTTPIEAGVSLVNGVDIVALSQTLTQFVGGFIKFFY
ncbi:helix-turn-helix transcriptional regulator [Sporosarcina sp. FSL K6-1522]|uniref:helix-turn-helix transcriptional regulator n=1 Tax=Sporosarcina sp. FSL K6-1522 TaxID=2921554 RepID=UPI003159FE43